MSPISRMTIAGFAMPLAVGAVDVQGGPDLSGRWRLNVDKSAYEQSPGPRLQTDTIEQTAGHIRLSVSSTNRNVTIRYDFALPTNGTRAAIPDMPRVDPARRLTAAWASWDGATLAIRAELATDSGPAVVVDRYTVSPDRSELTVRTERGDGRLIRTLVFDRCGASGMACR